MSDDTPTTDLSEDIAELAAGPKGVTIDGTTVNERPIGELIAADKHLANKAAGKTARKGRLPFPQFQGRGTRSI